MPQETPVKGEETPSDLQDWRLADASFINNVSEISRDDPQKYNIFEEDGSLRIWWFDVYERRDKGDIYLFGKVLDKSTQRYVSCSVAVRNILRDIYILPRTHQLDTQGKVTNVPVIMDNVFSEISDICTNYGITRWTDSICTRKYAFELPDIPAETKYLRIGYGFNQPALPMELKGKTFSHVFGINTNPLEHFLIERDIMGPCWLVIKNAKIVSTNESWCKTELSIDSPEHCTPLRDADGNAPQHIPPLSVMSLCLRTVRNTQKNSNEIVAASVFISTQVKIDQSTHIDQQDTLRFNVVRKLANKVYPAGFESLVLKEKDQNTLITVESTESSLLNFLIAKIHTNDPDVIVGHNFLGFDLDILLHRMKFLNTQHWHKLGRLKRTHWPRLQNGPGGTGESTYEEKMVMSGRLVCDTYMAAKDLIQSKSYRMTELAQSQLKIAREDIQFDQTEAFYESAPSLIHLLKHCSFDSYLAMALMFKLQILPLTLQLTNLAGNLWSRTLLGARAERNEYLLLHEFHRQNFVCPDKTFGKKTRTDMFDTSEYAQEGETKSQAKKGSSRRKPAYAGGLVLEPKKGFYDKYVLLLDFNSLYPSIIQEYNICFTTVERKEISELEVETVPEIPDSMLHQGVLPRMIKTLVDRRGQVKRLMKDPKLSKAEYMQYDIRQKALKLTANSMYGCLGFSHSRFYAKPLAMLITHKGREILQNTVDLAGDLDLNVIYGDTDSVMLYTNQSDIAKAKEIGVLFKQRVNERYRLLEIDIDGLFKHILLLKKKKYAAVLVQEQPDGKLVETIEIRGLDLVRRDWCDLSHDVSSSVLNSILSDKDREEVVDEIHTYLRATGEKIRSGEIPIAKFIINKQLTKNPEDYADAKSQPHVQVAIRMKQSGQSVRTGETVPYVICKLDSLPENSKAGPAERAYHPDEVARSNMQLGSCSLDIEWYLNQQVFPPITRLCSDIDGTDPARIAEYLGLDKSKFNFRSGNGTEEDSEFGTLESQIGDQERFKNVEKLVLLCNKCEKEVILDSVFIQTSSNSMEWGLHCNYCLEDIHINNASNQLSVLIRRFIRKYYECWLVCDDSTCGNRTRMMSVYGRRCLNRGCLGLMHREFSDKALYTQLLYFSYFFDSKRIIHNAVSTKLESKFLLSSGLF
ncbi:DNA polymerase family B-domain-containing protein [Spinellus fusiger]|nr:DNA polymerase family B-domain-containing protein [Spinellus fusiger]